MATRVSTEDRVKDAARIMAAHLQHEGYLPTEKELAGQLGVGKSRAHQIIAELRNRGHLTGSGRRMRMVAETERMQ